MMTTRADMVREIKIAARVAELRRLAERTARAYDEAVAASGLPPEHFRLRLMLRGLLPPPRKAHSAALCVYRRCEIITESSAGATSVVAAHGSVTGGASP
jgi:hypothetical protein